MSKKPKTTYKRVEALLVLYKGKYVIGWFGGDGTRIPVFETGKNSRAEAKHFVKINKYHKPALVKCTITYALPLKANKKK